MFPTLGSVHETLGDLARDFDPGRLSGPDAARMVVELGAIRRLADGMLAKAARRVDTTAAFLKTGDADAAKFVARVVGIETGEARGAIALARQLDELPATDAAVRSGELSARQAQLIADAVALNPAAEHSSSKSSPRERPNSKTRASKHAPRSKTLPRDANASMRRGRFGCGTPPTA